MKVGELIMILSELDPEATIMMHAPMMREMERKAAVCEVISADDVDNPGAMLISHRGSGHRPNLAPKPHMRDHLVLEKKDDHD